MFYHLFAVFWLLVVLMLPTPAQAYVLHGEAWGSGGGTPATVSWSLMPTGTTPDAVNDSPGEAITSLADLWGGSLPTWKTEIEEAFQAWTDIAGITFTEVSDDGSAVNSASSGNFGQIRVGAHTFDGASGVLAHGYYPPADGVGNTTTITGDLHFDTAETWAVNSLDANTSTIDIFQVAAHEIGHAIGIDHTAVSGSLMEAIYSESFSGPQADDISAAQALYGASLNTTTATPLPGTLGLSLLGFGVFSFFSRKKAVVMANGGRVS